MIPQDDEKFCEWRWNNDGFWHSQCDLSWTLEDGTPKENGMDYCPRCAKPLVEVIEGFFDANEA